MKPLLTLGALLGTCLFVSAQPAPVAEKTPKAPKPPTAAELREYDKNKDGKLDETERAAEKADVKAKRAALRQERLAKYDKDKDGKLSEEEWTAMRADLKAAQYAKYDTNKDGKLSKEEREQIPPYENLPSKPKFGKGKSGEKKPVETKDPASTTTTAPATTTPAPVAEATEKVTKKQKKAAKAAAEAAKTAADAASGTVTPAPAKN